ncbi:helix-turn-helix domain-containing protein [Prescottella defluvii]|nr:helix-turn-helix domain-containing protein [Prescottella defluvii]
MNALVDAGSMERRPQSGGHERHDYMLTDLGLATWEFLVSVWSWQREWSAEGLLQPEMVHVDCGHRGPPELVCRHCGATVKPQDARLEMDRDSLVLVARGSRRRSTRNSPALSRADLQFTEVMEAIGDRWSALVTGLALSGVRRFGEFQSILKISPTTLTERLARLSDVQILTRSEGGREYVLTPRGRALFPIFAFLLAWTLTAHPGVSPEQLGPSCVTRAAATGCSLLSAAAAATSTSSARPSSSNPDPDRFARPPCSWWPLVRDPSEIL